jgi:hypothetical protein
MSQIDLVDIPGDQGEFVFVRALKIVKIKFLILPIRRIVLVIIYRQHRHANSVNSQRINKHEIYYMFRR